MSSDMLYLIQCDETQQIKIGVSKNPNKRLKQLQTGNGSKLRLLKVYQIENDIFIEKRLHKMFWQNRRKGEWFQFSPLHEYLDVIDNYILMS